MFKELKLKLLYSDLPALLEQWSNKLFKISLKLLSLEFFGNGFLYILFWAMIL